jgi:mRNA interferase RelE/StbE
MLIEFKKTFEKDLIDILDADLYQKIQQVIAEVETAENLREISNVKKLQGEAYYYRIRVGDYRVGIKLNDGVVYFVIILH